MALAVVASVWAAACAADPGDPLKSADTGLTVQQPEAAVIGDDVAVTQLPDSTIGAFDAPLASDDSSTPNDVAIAPEGSMTMDGPVASSCPTCPLEVDYECNQTTDPTNEIKPWYKIVNKGAMAQQLSELKVRYWYTFDASSGGTMPEQYACDDARVDTGGGNNMAITPDVMGMFAMPVPPKTDAGADSYMEISFTSAAGSIPAGLTATIQNRFHKNNYSGSYVQADDYSFKPAFTSFTAWDHVTLYRNGTLVWGVEP